MNLSKSRKILHKMSNSKIKEKERGDFTTNMNKFLDLKQFNDDLHDIFLGQR